MHRLTSVLILILLSTAQAAIAWADFLTDFGSGGNQFSVTFVSVGNPGSGGVGATYNISKHEISREMIDKANQAAPLLIGLGDLSGFGVGNLGSRPATGVTWNQAARFVNWLNTSQGYAEVYKFSTQPGHSGYNSNENVQAWSSGDSGYNAANVLRNANAKYFLPNFEEMTKAAYYDPTKDGVGGYWKFATRSDTAPTPITEGTSQNTAVYNQGGSFIPGPAEITKAGGLSFYGVMALNGNVAEWCENSPFNNNERRLFGGTWTSDEAGIQPGAFGYRHGDEQDILIGFRVASVPEPGMFGILLISMLLSASNVRLRSV